MTEKIAYIDIDITVMARVPFNGAPDEQTVLEDIFAKESSDSDAVEIHRRDYHKDNGFAINGVTEYMEFLGVRALKVVRTGELIINERGVVINDIKRS